MSSRAHLRQALLRAAPGDPGGLFRLAVAGIEAGLEREVRSRLAALPGDAARDPRLWQALGLAHRGLLDSAEAHHAFSRAAELAPSDSLIAHSRARTALEAGYPASALFEAAARLAPADGSVLLGRAAAQLAQGDGAAGLAGLEAVLAANPGWIDGHLAFASLQAVLDPAADPRRTLRTALARLPREALLWHALLRSHMLARDYAGAAHALGEARSALGERTEFVRIEAICRGECGEAEAALAMFATLPPAADGDEALWPVRALIRLGRLDEAARLAETRFAGPSDMALWPYRALVWRALGDPRWQWLEGDPRLIGSFDLTSRIGDLDALAEVLRGLHRTAAQPLEQSVRGGTQTDGMLFARAEPEIRRLREAAADAVRAYAAQLPPHDPQHPTLAPERRDPRFAGAWSVRLAGGGHHADHVHTQGWLSSVFYVALPADPATDSPDDAAGCLVFGECRELLSDFAGFRTVRPERGRLVLFPATMWHGTRRSAAGERLTAAFDVAVPKGEA